MCGLPRSGNRRFCRLFHLRFHLLNSRLATKMTLLIAVAGLLATIYAILPRERRLELRLRLTKVDLLIVAITFAIVFYCEHYLFFKAHPLFHKRWSGVRWPNGLGASSVSDIFLLLGVGVIAVRMQLRRLSWRNIATFSELLDELYWAGGFEEIFNFLERHRKALFRIQKSDYPLARLHKSLRPSFLDRTFSVDFNWLEESARPDSGLSGSRTALRSKPLSPTSPKRSL